MVGLQDYFHQACDLRAESCPLFPCLNVGQNSVEADHYNLSNIKVSSLHLNIFDFFWALYF